MKIFTPSLSSDYQVPNYSHETSISLLNDSEMYKFSATHDNLNSKQVTKQSASNAILNSSSSLNIKLSSKQSNKSDSQLNISNGSTTIKPYNEQVSQMRARQQRQNAADMIAYWLVIIHR